MGNRHHHKIAGAAVAFFVAVSLVFPMSIVVGFDSNNVSFGTGPVHNIDKDTYYQTIQAGVDDADPGNTIEVANGTYYERVWINKTLTLSGEGKNTQIVDDTQGSILTINEDNVELSSFSFDHSGSNWDTIAVKASYCDNITILNISVSNNTVLGSHNGIFLYNTNNSKIFNCSFSNNRITGNTSGAGICLKFSNNNKIINNEMSNNSAIYGYHGIYLYESANNIIRDNHFKNCYESISLYFSQLNNISYNSVIGGDGIHIRGSWNNTITNCNISNTDNGIYVYDDGGGNFAKHNTIINNIALNNQCGIHLYCTDNNTVKNNNASLNDRYGIELRYSSNNTIANNMALSNDWESILISWDSDNNIITNNNASSSGYGIFINDCSNNTVSSNHMSDNIYGIAIDEPHSINNTIFENDISSNEYGIYVSFSPTNNLIYHNNFINNTNQAYDNSFGNNSWDNGYPSGGNYWSDYVGVDLNSTPTQDIPPPDGLGDTPYIINGNSKDNYPLMVPTFYEYESYISLSEGWNLISIPLIQCYESIHQVLDNITGKWDYIQAYDALDSDHWKTNATFKPDQLNDLKLLNHKIGFWINITEPNVNLTVYGYKTEMTSIPLYAGWNLVGYPTLNDTMTVANALWGTGADRVEVCDTSEPYNLKEVVSTYVMKPGEGYWIHVPADTIWVVDW